MSQWQRSSPCGTCTGYTPSPQGGLAFVFSSAWALSQGIWTLKGPWLDRSSERSGKGNNGLEVEETVQLSPLPFMEHWSRDRQRKCSATFFVTSRTKLVSADDATAGASSASRKSSLKTRTTCPRTSDLLLRRSSTRAILPNVENSASHESSRKRPTSSPRNDFDVGFPTSSSRKTAFYPPHVRTQRGPP